jgi:hypothetical protein
VKRTTFLLAAFAFASFHLLAQTKEEKAAKKHQEAIQKSKEKGTVILYQDTIYNAGAAYGIFKNEGTLLMQKYRCYALSGKEAFFVDGTIVKNFWHFNFNSLGGKQVDVPMDIKTPVYKMVVDNNLLTPKDINTEKAHYFLVRFGPHKTGFIPGGEITQVQRNRKAMILAYDNKIFQDGKVIGTYEKKVEGTKEYGPGKVCYIYFSTGALCARAILPTSDVNKAIVTTQLDDKTGTVTDAVLEVDDIAKYLVDGQYL